MTDLPQYTIRESVRAKHVLLKMSLHNGLVVVVPSGFDVQQVPHILRGKRGWIERGMKRIEHRRDALGAESAWDVPKELVLRAINEEWRIECQQTASSRVMLMVHDDQRLVLLGDVNNHAMDKMALRRFLMRKARKDLAVWLRSLADQHGFAVNGARVRLQKTRWGSCSQRGMISLNAKLLFLPRDLVKYVFIHELCHTVHHNHSANFWRLVQEHMPQAETLRRRLREDAWRFIPPWLDGEWRGSQETGVARDHNLLNTE